MRLTGPGFPVDSYISKEKCLPAQQLIKLYTYLQRSTSKCYWKWHTLKVFITWKDYCSTRCLSILITTWSSKRYLFTTSDRNRNKDAWWTKIDSTDHDSTNMLKISFVMVLCSWERVKTKNIFEIKNLQKNNQNDKNQCRTNASIIKKNNFVIRNNSDLLLVLKPRRGKIRRNGRIAVYLPRMV